MSGIIYRNPYSLNEIKFEIELNAENVLNYISIKTGEKDLDVNLNGVYFAKTDGTGTVIPIRLDLEQMVIPTTGGVNIEKNIDYLSANLDLTRDKNDLLDFLTILKDDISTPLNVDRSNALNILRSESEVSKGVVSFSPNLDFRYKLKPNTNYLLIVEILRGATTGTSKGVISGTLREVRN